MDRKGQSSDDLIAAARDSANASQGSLSASMAKEARDEVGTFDATYVPPDVGEAEPSVPSDRIEPVEPVEEWTSRRRPLPPEPTQPKPTQRTPTRPKPTKQVPKNTQKAPPTRRISGRRLVGLVVAGFMLFSIFSSNFDGIGDFFQDQFGRDDGALPASNEAADVDLVNLALDQPITGSSESQSDVANVVDGDQATEWNAGGFAPQWVLIDLGSVSTVHTVRLLTGQSPDGQTTHQVHAWGPDMEEQLLHEFTGETSDRTWLEVTFDEPISGIDTIGVLTIQSPAWVAWYEVEVEGPSQDSTA